MAALPIEAAKRLSDRLVHLHDERLVRRRARLGAVLSKAVVGHDGVVHGVADDGEQGRPRKVEVVPHAVHEERDESDP
jgi:hypothetical protein